MEMAQCKYKYVYACMCLRLCINRQKEKRDLDDSVEFNVVVVVSTREFKKVPACSRCVLVV